MADQLERVIGAFCDEGPFIADFVLSWQDAPVRR
jgi:hypothetical protein